MSFFDAFYFMSYTASTIGFGELPFPFNANQRMWVTISIYLTVIGWAYAIGSLLSLIQDRAFRNALALQRFTRKVRRLREPFLLFAGYGQTGELLGRSFDALGQQFVVIDQSPERIESLDLVAYHADIPGLAGDVRNPHHLAVAGLDHPYCSGVLALTSDDEVNLAVTMAAALLRPDLPVIARTVSPAIEDRMHAFGTPSVINPFDRFGDHLRLALRAPASYQLLTWLESGPGGERPKRGRPPTHGRWVLCGYGRFGQEMAKDLRAEGLEVTIIEPIARAGQDPDIIVGDGSDPAVMERGRPRRRRRFCRRHRQRHHQSVPGGGGPADQPGPVRRGPAEPAGQRSAVRRDEDRLAAGADRGGRPRGVRPAEHPVALALPAGDAGQGRRLGRCAAQADHPQLRSEPATTCGRSG